MSGLQIAGHFIITLFDSDVDDEKSRIFVLAFDGDINGVSFVVCRSLLQWAYCFGQYVRQCDRHVLLWERGERMCRPTASYFRNYFRIFA